VAAKGVFDIGGVVSGRLPQDSDLFSENQQQRRHGKNFAKASLASLAWQHNGGGAGAVVSVCETSITLAVCSSATSRLPAGYGAAFGGVMNNRGSV
jgi:hypothetical protein